MWRLEFVLEDVSVGISAFMRPSKLEKVLQSIDNLENKPVEVIVCDNSPKKDKNRHVSESFQESLNLRYLGLEGDVGVSTSRNRIVEETSTDYVMILDDDQYLNEGIEDLKCVLEENSGIGGIAPSLIEDGEKMVDARDIRIKDGWVIADTSERKEKRETSSGIQYFIYDFTATCALYRTEALQEIGWDENFKIGGEHLDFFLDYKRNSDWSFAVTEDVCIFHDPGPGENEDYLDERRSIEKLGTSRKYFCEKWGVRGFLFRERRAQHYDSTITRFSVKLFYSLPNSIHWKLKGTRKLEELKELWTQIFDENKM